VRLGHVEDRGRVRHRASARQRAGRTVEAFDRRSRAARAIGVREVSHQRDLVDARQRRERLLQRGRLVRRDPETVHAGVQLEPHVDGAALVRAQPLEVRGVVDGE